MEKYLPKEKQNRKIGIGVSVGIHALLLILFMIFAAYKPPYPPNPGIPGVELNFGLTDAGMGEVQNETNANTENTEDAKPEEASSPETTEEVVEENTPESQQAEVTGENIETSPVESPHQVQEQSNVSAEVSNNEKVTEAATPKNETAELKDGGGGEAGETNEAASSSNGDQNVMGDQGSKKGSVDARALYGAPGTGGGNGPKLNMDGWQWDQIPNKVDPSSEKGYIIFEFEVDDYGMVINVNLLEKTVSSSVEKFYEDQLRTTTFSPTGSNIVNYKGTVRFEVKAQ